MNPSFPSFPILPRLILLAAFFISCGKLSGQEEIAIGLVLQDSSSVCVLQAAQMAVDKANSIQKEKKFVLVSKSMEGPWGTGAGRAVDLVFTEKVCAVIASADGRNSHLAEQVSAKTQVPFISAWSGDPTLAQAFVPWYYCVVPNYLQQAESISRQISLKPGKTVVISGDDYDSQLAAKSFLKIASAYSFTSLLLPEKELSNLSEIKPDYIVLFFLPEKIKTINRELNNLKLKSRIVFSISFNQEEISSQEITMFEGAYIIGPGYLFTQKGNEFRREFLKRYNCSPGSAAAFVYDAVTLVTEAAGKSRDNLKQVLDTSEIEGVTGKISFDKNGNRNGLPELMKAESGRLVKLN